MYIITVIAWLIVHQKNHRFIRCAEPRCARLRAARAKNVLLFPSARLAWHTATLPVPRKAPKKLQRRHIHTHIRTHTPHTQHTLVVSKRHTDVKRANEREREREHSNLLCCHRQGTKVAAALETGIMFPNSRHLRFVCASKSGLRIAKLVLVKRRLWVR